jgi:hypothetical protein
VQTTPSTPPETTRWSATATEETESACATRLCAGSGGVGACVVEVHASVVPRGDDHLVVVRGERHRVNAAALVPAEPPELRARGHVPHEHLLVPAARREAGVVRRAGDVADLVRVARVRLDERRLVGIPQAERAVAPARQQVRAGAREPHAQHGALVRDQARVLLGGVRGRRRHRGSESPRAPACRAREKRRSRWTSELVVFAPTTMSILSRRARVSRSRSRNARRDGPVPRAPALAPWSATRGARSSSASTGGVTT